ncbi:LacI family DNA-binding transcriptional regulator [Kocuria rhizophila]|nr:LacI family DNA-binding transcriptional regulator [Kocuria rhizophila]
MGIDSGEHISMDGGSTPYGGPRARTWRVLAGLRRTTVSFVLNDAPAQSISAETRRRVLDAAHSLFYAPSAEARALSSGRSTSCSCLPLRVPCPEQWDVIERLSVLFEEAGLSMVIHAWTAAPPRTCGPP